MLVIRTYKSKSSMIRDAHILDCPNCDFQMNFYMHSPDRCASCGIVLPTYHRMITSSTARTHYHMREGKH